jgi:hypothetical protein
MEPIKAPLQKTAHHAPNLVVRILLLTRSRVIAAINPKLFLASNALGLLDLSKTTLR